MTTKKTGKLYATRNVFVEGTAFQIGDEIQCSPEDRKMLVQMGRASTTYPKAAVEARKRAEEARRQAEVAEDQAAQEEFDAAVAAAVEAALAKLGVDPKKAAGSGKPAETGKPAGEAGKAG